VCTEVDHQVLDLAVPGEHHMPYRKGEEEQGPSHPGARRMAQVVVLDQVRRRNFDRAAAEDMALEVVRSHSHRALPVSRPSSRTCRHAACRDPAVLWASHRQKWQALERRRCSGVDGLAATVAVVGKKVGSAQPGVASRGYKSEQLQEVKYRL
jgi:hypothetical protein